MNEEKQQAIKIWRWETFLVAHCNLDWTYSSYESGTQTFLILLFLRWIQTCSRRP
ncbi:uncharacterized protein LY89DRAFT_683318 [Mollisia scopiformis]|uniref:Uncharacterized protein n=1 Tax=Mollisia scopiformis TaxID=149040 RepID=A0A194XH79_MOLSC|nr:uncharacterized protein LY89DRAFT_683318 [Mollisia scopiformis]KUJ19496.1 hypothetical protein LY89DRAFT_683318 [Mollisia scopiformis]